MIALCAAVACVGAVSSTAAPRVPIVVAVIGSGANRALVRVDAQTLEPLRGARRIRLPRGAVFALSPNSSRVAVATDQKFFIADTMSGRVVLGGGDGGGAVEEGLYWVGTSADPLIIAVGDSKFGWEYTAIPGASASTDTDLAPAVALHDVLVLSGEAGLDYFSREETFVKLDEAPVDEGLFRVVGDVAHDVVYVVYSAGIVAKVGETVTYHKVQLNGRPFDAIWAGHHEIALWGADGLGIIDTRTWQTRAIAPEATGAVASRYGIVTWDSTTTGVDVYASNGTRRLHVLRSKGIENVTARGRYAYARTAEPKQFAIDLKTGRVRAIRGDAELAVPSVVSIP